MAPVQPIFLDAGIIFISGGNTPSLGVAFGTGYRANLLQPNPNVNRFFYVIDPGLDQLTLNESNLNNITPNGGDTPARGTDPIQAATSCTNSGQTNCGYFLDFAKTDEKAVSSVFSSLGRLTLVTFLPKETTVLCGNGTSFRYRFLFTNGQGGYNATQSLVGPGELGDYRQSLGEGLATASQSQAPNGQLIDTLIFSTGELSQENTGSLKTLSESWKEQ